MIGQALLQKYMLDLLNFHLLLLLLKAIGKARGNILARNISHNLHGLLFANVHEHVCTARHPASVVLSERSLNSVLAVHTHDLIVVELEPLPTTGKTLSLSFVKLLSSPYLTVVIEFSARPDEGVVMSTTYITCMDQHTMQNIVVRDFLFFLVSCACILRIVDLLATTATGITTTFTIFFAVAVVVAGAAAAAIIAAAAGCIYIFVELESCREFEPVVNFRMTHTLQIEIESLQVDGQNGWKLRKNDSFSCILLSMLTASIVLVLTFEHLFFDVFGEALVDVGTIFHIKLDIIKVFFALGCVVNIDTADERLHPSAKKALRQSIDRRPLHHCFNLIYEHAHHLLHILLHEGITSVPAKRTQKVRQRLLDRIITRLQFTEHVLECEAG